MHIFSTLWTTSWNLLKPYLHSITTCKIFQSPASYSCKHQTFPPTPLFLFSYTQALYLKFSFLTLCILVSPYTQRRYLTSITRNLCLFPLIRLEVLFHMSQLATWQHHSFKWLILHIQTNTPNTRCLLFFYQRVFSTSPAFTFTFSCGLLLLLKQLSNYLKDWWPNRLYAAYCRLQRMAMSILRFN